MTKTSLPPIFDEQLEKELAEYLLTLSDKIGDLQRDNMHLRESLRECGQKLMAEIRGDNLPLKELRMTLDGRTPVPEWMKANRTVRIWLDSYGTQENENALSTGE